MKKTHLRKPEWMRVRIGDTAKLNKVNRILNDSGLNTVCVEANCPNRLDCFSKKTATFMILGSHCTRNCRFCNVMNGQPETVDPTEPLKVAKAVKDLGLKHAVITSVTRDDLPDGGAQQFVEVIESIRAESPGTTIEVLIPDFQGNEEALRSVVQAHPEIINHNVETVPRLYDAVRPQANYKQSLEVIKHVKSMDKTIITKSGIMLGLGEKEEEVQKVMKDLLEYQCEVLTIGQYLAPSKEHYEMERYVTPEEFETYRVEGEAMGFAYVASAPMVRSSYNASEALQHMAKN
jgi:lipoic acid synthetase